MTSRPDSLDLCDDDDIGDPGPGPNSGNSNTDPGSAPAIKMLLRRQGGEWIPDLADSDEEMEDENEAEEEDEDTWEDVDMDITEPTVGDILGELGDKPETQFQDPIKSYRDV